MTNSVTFVAGRHVTGAETPVTLADRHYQLQPLVCPHDGQTWYLVETPLPTIASMFFIVGIQLILMGVMAEILMRTYYESQHKTTYTIKELINFDGPGKLAHA